MQFSHQTSHYPAGRVTRSSCCNCRHAQTVTASTFTKLVREIFYGASFLYSCMNIISIKTSRLGDNFNWGTLQAVDICFGPSCTFNPGCSEDKAMSAPQNTESHQGWVLDCIQGTLDHRLSCEIRKPWDRGVPFLECVVLRRQEAFLRKFWSGQHSMKWIHWKQKLKSAQKCLEHDSLTTLQIM